MTDDETITWRAPRPTVAFAGAAIAALMIAVVLVLTRYGVASSVVGGLLVLGAIGQVWWMVLRPRLTARTDGVQIVAGRTPVRLGWKEIRSVEATADGLTITASNGRTARSPYPRRARGEATGEADRVAAFLMQRAAWARRPTGSPPPRYAP